MPVGQWSHWKGGIKSSNRTHCDNVRALVKNVSTQAPLPSRMQLWYRINYIQITYKPIQETNHETKLTVQAWRVSKSGHQGNECMWEPTPSKHPATPSSAEAMYSTASRLVWALMFLMRLAAPREIRSSGWRIAPYKKTDEHVTCSTRHMTVLPALCVPRSTACCLRRREIGGVASSRRGCSGITSPPLVKVKKKLAAEVNNKADWLPSSCNTWPLGELATAETTNTPQAPFSD